MNHTRATTADETRPMELGKLVLLCLAAWAVPGAGHLWQRQTSKGLVFLAVLPLMFGLGLLMDGTLFSLAPSAQSLLTTGAALAERGMGAALAPRRARSAPARATSCRRPTSMGGCSWSSRACSTAW